MFARLLGTVWLTNMLDMTSLASSYWLQNVIEYCIKVRKTGQAGRVNMTQGSTLMTQNVFRDCQVEWRGVSPVPTNWWATCTE